MSKMSELDLIFTELKECGNTLINISESLTALFTRSNVEQESTIEAPEVDPTPQATELSFLDVRKKFADISRAGHTEKLKGLLNKYGAEKLSSLDPAHYAAILAEAEALL